MRTIVIFKYMPNYWERAETSGTTLVIAYHGKRVLKCVESMAFARWQH